MSRLKRPSGLLFLFFVVLSASIFLLPVRQLRGEDSAVSGGTEGSTSVVTGTKEECKEPGGTGTVECIVHTHEYDATTTNTACSAAGRIAPSGGEMYCVTQSISYSLSKTGEDTVGKKTTTYSACTICGQPYPGTNPEISDHDVTFPSNPKWDALDCGANPASGDGETASFVGNTPSSSVNGSSVVFKFDDGLCKTHCGKLVIGPYTVNFTVVGVESVSSGDVTSTTDTPGADETLYVAEGAAGETITITATPDPSDASWPDGAPVWTGATGSGATATFPIDVASSTADGTTVTATCGTSAKAMKSWWLK